jgi:hypothetical protein
MCQQAAMFPADEAFGSVTKNPLRAEYGGRIDQHIERWKALAVSDAELEAADAKARVKKAVDYFERHYRTNDEQMRQWLGHVVPQWHSSNYEQRAMLEATWMPLLLAERERREKARAERAAKVEQGKWEDQRKAEAAPQDDRGRNRCGWLQSPRQGTPPRRRRQPREHGRTQPRRGGAKRQE